VCLSGGRIGSPGMASEVLNLARRIMGVQRNAVVVHKPCWEPTWCPEIQSV